MTSADDKLKDLEREHVQNTGRGCPIRTGWGVRVENTDTTLKAGARGPTLVEDFHFREKISHFDHERIPERVVHARGNAAHGFFRVYESLERITKAGFLCDPSRRTPVFLRFSTVLGSRGSADTVRDVRGFAVRFYTPEGNFDMVGNNIPVFFIQDAMQFPDVIHAGKPEPHTEMPQAATAHDNFWDWIGLQSQAAHMAMWILSDRTVPRSLRMVEGFGVHTFVLVDARGRRRFVKFHWKPLLGAHSIPWDESQKLCGVDPDFHRRDLYEAIEAGNFPEWELAIQVVEEEDEHKFDFDILDATKIIPEDLVPLQRVGRLTLNRNPSNVFAETEQVAFCTQHVVPGIDQSDDPLLHGRNFSYQDTQLLRLGGPNFTQIPINRPLCPVFNNQRDGYSTHRIPTDSVNYFPNRFGAPSPTPAAQGGYAHYAEKVAGVKERARGPKFADHFSQAQLFYNSLSPLEKERLIDTASFELGHCSEDVVKQNMLKIFSQIDTQLTAKVAQNLGMDAPAPPAGWKNHGKTSKGLSLDEQPKGDITTLKVAILVSNGFDAEQVTSMTAVLKARGAVPNLVGTSGSVRSNAGVSTKVDFTFFACKSVQFDAVYIPGGEHASALAGNGTVLAFVNEAFKHLKAVCAIAEGINVLRKCAFDGVKLADNDGPVVDDDGVVTAGSVFEGKAKTAEGLVGGKLTGAVSGVATLVGVDAGAASAFVTAIGQYKFWARDVSKVPV